MSIRPTVALSPLRPVFRDILFTSLAAEEAGAKLIGMVVQMDLPKLGLTGEAIVTDIQAAPYIEPLSGPQDDRRIVTAKFHHSNGDVIDLLMGESSRHSPSDEAKRDTTSPSSNQLRDGPPMQSAVLGAESSVTAASVTEESGHSASGITEDSDGHFAVSTASIPDLKTENRTQKTVGSSDVIRSDRWIVRNTCGPVRWNSANACKRCPATPKSDFYHLEVHAEHVYFVGKDGALMNNAKRYDVNSQDVYALVNVLTVPHKYQY